MVRANDVANVTDCSLGSSVVLDVVKLFLNNPMIDQIDKNTVFTTTVDLPTLLKGLQTPILLQELQLLVSQAIEHRVVQQKVVHLLHVHVVVSQLRTHGVDLGQPLIEPVKPNFFEVFRDHATVLEMGNLLLLEFQ